jgi:hypothetical protein
MRRPIKLLLPLAAALALVVFQALPALACGSLVAPNGAIRLARATTLVAWHGGVEQYMTSFTYQGDFSDVGWIVPLPTLPDKIQEGGAWTLQRLNRETHPIVADDSSFGLQNRTAAASSAIVVQQTRVEALDIKVLKGSGPEVISWCEQNNFFVNADTRAHLLAYGKGSPYFLTAKYDTSAAKARHQLQGDGAPVLITMHTTHIWVPLEVLALDDQQVQADLYLLTDQPVYTSELGATVGQSQVGTQVPNAPGFTLAFQEQMNPSLFHDLSTDRNMGWVRSDSWLTYLTLDAPEKAVSYDLGVAPNGVIRLAPFGTPPMVVVDGVASQIPTWVPRLPLGTPQVALAVLFVLILLGGLVVLYRIEFSRERKTPPTGA